MRRIIPLALCLFISSLSFSQCPAGNITLSTQAEVDDFVLTYPGCTELLGNLIIEGNSINNFKGLSGITQIAGSLRVLNTQILDFMGLQFLETVGGEFDINNNSTLINLSGLDLLASVRRFFVYQNQSLKSLDGIDSLTTITDLESISIFDNESLISINALSTVVNCPDCFIVVEANPNLTNLEGLENIPPDDMFFLRLVDNQNLVVCNLQNICTYLLDGGDHTIENNASGCSSAAEILDNCFFSIAEQAVAIQIVLAPNPVSEKFLIRVAEGMSFKKATVYSIFGEQLFLTTEETIDCTQLTTGIYFVEVTTDRGSITKKIIKK